MEAAQSIAPALSVRWFP